MIRTLARGATLRSAPQRGGAPEALVVLLHGVGAGPATMAGLALALSQGLPAAAVVVPEGFDPFDGGGAGRQWFSILGVTEENRPGRVAAVLPRLDAVIDAEASHAGVARDRTVVVGFSQGAILALHLAAGARSLAAVASLAGRLAGPAPFGDGPRPPVLLSHGEADPVIPFAFQAAAAAALAQAGCEVELQSLPGHGHAVAPTQVARVVEHLRTALLRPSTLRRAS